MQRSSFELNDKEKKVLGAFPKAGSALTIEEMARKAFDTKRVGASPKTRGNSWVRNSVRKLLRLKLLKGGDKSGKYERTEVKPEDVLREAELQIDADAQTEADKKASKKTKGKAKAKVKKAPKEKEAA